MRHGSKLAKICVSHATQGLALFHGLHTRLASPSCLWVVCTDLEKVSAAFPAMIGGRKELQDHFMDLTQLC